LIEANCITKLLHSDGLVVDELDEQQYIEYSKKPDLDEMIYSSIAPAIYGHYGVKRALTLAMFGGV